MSFGYITRAAYLGRRVADQHNDFFLRNILVTSDGTSTSKVAERNRLRSNVPWCPWPTYEDLAQWAHSEGVAASQGQDETSNSPAFQMSLMSAIDHICEDTGLPYLVVDDDGETVDPPSPGTVPVRVHQATLIHALRLYRRRLSPDGTLGASAFGGQVRVSRYDPDVRALLGNWLRAGIA